MLKRVNINYKTILIFLFCFLAVFPLYQMIASRGHREESLNNYSSVSPMKAVTFDELAKGDNAVNNSAIINQNPADSWDGFSNDKISDGFVTSFYGVQTISKITINFSDSYPINFDIEAYSPSGWKTIDRVRNNSNQYYLGYFDGVQTDKIRFTSHKTFSGVVKIVDSFYYTAQRNNIVKSLYKSLFVFAPSFGSGVFYILFFILCIFTGGFVLWHPFTKLFPENIPLNSFGMGFVYWFLVGYVCNIVRIDEHKTILMSIIALLGSINLILTVRRRKMFIEQLYRERIIYIISLLFLFFIFVWTFIFENRYTGSHVLYDLYYNNSPAYQIFGSYTTDQMFPFLQIKQIFYGADNMVGSWTRSEIMANALGRPQFFTNAFIIFYRVFGDNFFVFQSIVIASISMLLVSVYSFVKSIFSSKIAYITIALLILNYYIFYIFQLTQIKLIAIFFVFILLGLISEYKKNKKIKYLYLAGFFGGLGILTHNSMVAYVCAGLFFLQPNLIKIIKSPKITLSYLVLPITMFAIWFVAAKMNGGIDLINAVIIGKVAILPSTWPQVGLMSRIAQIIYPRYLNFIGLFQLNPYPQTWDRIPYGVWRVTLSGAISFSALFFVAWGLVRRIKQTDLVVGLLVIPFVFALGSHSFPSLFGVHLYLIPTIIVLLSLAATIVVKSRRLLIVIFILSIVERLFVGFLVYPSETTSGLSRIIAINPLHGLLLFSFLILPISILLLIVVKQAVATDNSDKGIE
ncbi:MAG: glycosyltransferase family 39 protein [Candidatus Berkelbacteria bacterium]